MKKLFTLFCLLALTASVSAADPDFENDYTLVRSVTFDDGTELAGTETCAYTAYCTSSHKQEKLTVLTAPEAAAGWIALWTTGWNRDGWLNVKDYGLYTKKPRSACVFGDDLTTGWLVVFQCTQTASNVLTLTDKSGSPDGTFAYTLSEDGLKYICTITEESDAYVGFCGVASHGYITSISVYKPKNAAVYTTYTVKYEDMDGNTLKEAETYEALSGTPIVLSDYDKANIVVGNYTYVYDSDDIDGRNVAADGSTVVTVKFHRVKNFNYTVNEMCAGTAARVTKGFSYEMATVVAPYRKYNAVDGQLYKRDVTNKEYNYRFTLTAEGQVENLEYSAVDGVDNVVFLTEGEDVDGLTPCISDNTAVRSSNAASAYADDDTRIARLSAGTYRLHAIICDCHSNPDSHWVFMAGDEQIADFNCTVVNFQEFDSEAFTLTEETDIIMLAAGDNRMGLDAFYITGDGKEISEKPLTLPEGVVAWDWELEGQLSDADYITTVQVAFDGTDVYLRGLSYYNEEAWIKGTLDTETNLVTFPRGQYVGMDVDDPLYMIGLAYRNFCDIEFQYDVLAQTLTQVTPTILENGNEKTLDVRYYWTNVVLKSQQTAGYMVRYVDEEGNEIKPARIGWGMIGGVFDMPGSEFDPIFMDDNQTKYILVSVVGDYNNIDDEYENNVVTLVFKKGKLCYATASCIANGSYETLAQYEETFYDCEELTIDIPWGLRGADGKCYFTSSNTGEGNHGRYVLFPSGYTPNVHYGKTYYVAPILYNEDPSVAYYADCATLVLPTEGNEYGKGLGQCSGSYGVTAGNIGYSLANTISLQEGSYFWTEPIAEAGTYRVAIYLHKGFLKATDEPFVLGYRDAEGNEFLYTDLNIPAYGEGYLVETNITENVSIPAGASLIVMNRLPENEISFDDITLYRTGDFVEPIAVGINDLKDSKDFKDFKDTKDLKDAIFNLAGQRLQKMQKGINIIGGKKILR